MKHCNNQYSKHNSVNRVNIYSQQLNIQYSWCSTEVQTSIYYVFSEQYTAHILYPIRVSSNSPPYIGLHTILQHYIMLPFAFTTSQINLILEKHNLQYDVIPLFIFAHIVCFCSILCCVCVNLRLQSTVFNLLPGAEYKRQNFWQWEINKTQRSYGKSCYNVIMLIKDSSYLAIHHANKAHKTEIYRYLMMFLIKALTWMGRLHDKASIDVTDNC